MNLALAPDVHRFLASAAALLRATADPDKLLAHYVRGARELFAADQACVAMAERGTGAMRLRHATPRDRRWNEPALARALAEPGATTPKGLMAAALERRGRRWGVLAIARSGGAFQRGTGHALGLLAQDLSDELRRIDRDRLFEVRGRIDRKIVRDLPPKDLYYQVLDGLHTLTRYDHSSSLFILDEGSGRLELVAEQIAWRKAKSARIGSERALPETARACMLDGVVYGFDRRDGTWAEWTDHGGGPFAALLAAPGEAAAAGAPPADAVLLAPLGTREGALGLLELSARHAGMFGPYDADILERFTPLVSLAIQRAQGTERLRERVISAERKHVMADLARGVAHDINNALGAMLPLVQQLRDDLSEGRIDTAEAEQDLKAIEESVQVCRRIFSGMLGFARAGARHLGQGDVRRALQATAGVLDDSLSRQGIGLENLVEAGLPDVECGPSDLEQLFLNLMTNAREAMPSGGTLRLEARVADGHIEVRISDTGHGIPPEHLARIEEPFFTTKPQGTGLGLATCRAIVAGIGGRLRIESRAGEGTVVTVLLPVRAAE
jgi:two-component system, NtrC family, sensor kinase